VERVVVYGKGWCPYCDRAKGLLRRKGIPFEEIDVEATPGAEAEMVRRSGGRRTVPQIFLGDRHLGGSDDLHALDARGELDRLLAEAATKEASVERHDVVIIGSGPAGLTAALYCARASLAPVVIEGLAAGGQLMNTTDVENFPGFPEGIQGPELMELFKKQAARFGTAFVTGDATRVDFSSRPFAVHTEDRELRALAVIVATGASPRTLGVKGEKEYAGRGVSYCATCDGFFFRGQEIFVIGGGDSAMEEALFLTKFGARVTVVHRRDQFRASKIMADRVQSHEKIRVLWDSAVDEVAGDGQKVGSVRIRNVRTGELAEHECGGFFVAIGHTPNTALFETVLPRDAEGYLKIEGSSSYTNVRGVFAAGDVHDHVYRQAITAAGAGCRAAIDCERWLEAEGRTQAAR
jgi:thioredoxin reductase (NADPH)